MTSVLIIGGSGMLGAALARSAVEHGHDVTVASRRPRTAHLAVATAVVDVTTGDGLEAVRDHEIVVFAVNSQRSPRRVMVDGLRRVLDAAHTGAAPTVVLPSIVGCDKVANSYYRAKVAQEQLVNERDVPHSIVRLAQFHELVATLLHSASRIGLTPRSSLTLQPTSAAAGATALLAHVRSDATGITEIVGPERATLSELARTWARHTGRVRLPMPIAPRLIGARSAAAFASSSDAVTTGPSFQQWLEGDGERDD